MVQFHGGSDFRIHPTNKVIFIDNDRTVQLTFYLAPVGATLTPIVAAEITGKRSQGYRGKRHPCGHVRAENHLLPHMHTSLTKRRASEANVDEAPQIARARVGAEEEEQAEGRCSLNVVIKSLSKSSK